MSWKRGGRGFACERTVSINCWTALSKSSCCGYFFFFFTSGQPSCRRLAPRKLPAGYPERSSKPHNIQLANPLHLYEPRYMSPTPGGLPSTPLPPSSKGSSLNVIGSSVRKREVQEVRRAVFLPSPPPPENERGVEEGWGGAGSGAEWAKAPDDVASCLPPRPSLPRGSPCKASAFSEAPVAHLQPYDENETKQAGTWGLWGCPRASSKNLKLYIDSKDTCRTLRSA